MNLSKSYERIVQIWNSEVKWLIRKASQRNFVDI